MVLFTYSAFYRVKFGIFSKHFILLATLTKYIPFMLLYSREETLLVACSLLSNSSVVPGISESVREDVVLVRSVEVTVRCHDGMLGAAGVEPTMGDGNCFLNEMLKRW